MFFIRSSVILKNYPNVPSWVHEILNEILRYQWVIVYEMKQFVDHQQIVGFSIIFSFETNTYSANPLITIRSGWTRFFDCFLQTSMVEGSATFQTVLFLLLFISFLGADPAKQVQRFHLSNQLMIKMIWTSHIKMIQGKNIPDYLSCWPWCFPLSVIRFVKTKRIKFDMKWNWYMNHMNW